jgi:hypothetical protein
MQHETSTSTMTSLPLDTNAPPASATASAGAPPAPCSTPLILIGSDQVLLLLRATTADAPQFLRRWLLTVWLHLHTRCHMPRSLHRRWISAGGSQLMPAGGLLPAGFLGPPLPRITTASPLSLAHRAQDLPLYLVPGCRRLCWRWRALTPRSCGVGYCSRRTVDGCAELFCGCTIIRRDSEISHVDRNSAG